MRISASQVAPPGPQMISSRGIATRYGVHLASIRRWVVCGAIPPPDQTICRRHYWRLETLEMFDRRSTAKRAAKRQPPSRVEKTA